MLPFPNGVIDFTQVDEEGHFVFRNARPNEFVSLTTEWDWPGREGCVNYNERDYTAEECKEYVKSILTDIFSKDTENPTGGGISPFYHHHQLYADRRPHRLRGALLYALHIYTSMEIPIVICTQ
eukprot:SAG25_NODE_4800_length_747_cov_1.453704_1_plen_123_part_10